jgi:hypothetical protein
MPPRQAGGQPLHPIYPLLALFQNGERLRPENGYPVRLFLPGYEGNMSVKWLRRIKVTPTPTMTKDETSRYTDLQADGKSLMFTYPMEVKSLITRPSHGLTHSYVGDSSSPGTLPNQRQSIIDSRREMEVRQLQFHPPGFDLREVQDVVDQGQQMLSGRVNVLQVFLLLLVQLPEHALGQHFGEPDDGVEGRPELVRHFGQDLGLLLAGDLELAALVLDLPEEASVLNGQCRLRREGAEWVDCLRWEVPRPIPRHAETPTSRSW